MDPGARPAPEPEPSPPSSSSAEAASSPSAPAEPPQPISQLPPPPPSSASSSSSSQQQQHQHHHQQPSRYESQKRRDWNTFLQHLKNHKPPLALSRCSAAHVIEFLKYLDQFGKTKVHAAGCPHFGEPNPPGPCACPLKQAWGSLDALIGRLRAAYEENGGKPESNPFGAKAVRIYLREVRESQAKARGIPYEKKKRKRLTPPPPPLTAATAQSSGTVAVEAGSSSAAAKAEEEAGAEKGGNGKGEGSGSATTERGGSEPTPPPISAAQ